MRKVFWMVAGVMMLFAGCKEESINKPLLSTGAVTGIELTGVEFHGKITVVGDQALTDYGFIYTSADAFNASSTVFSFGKPPVTGEFSAKVVFDLLTSHDYIVRTFVSAGPRTYYGNTVKFKSPPAPPIGAATISDFNPASGSSGTVITINGNNFDIDKYDWGQFKTTVSIGDVVGAFVTTITRRQITFKVPEGVSVAGYYPLRVYSNGGIVTSSGKFFLEGPILDSFTPLSGPSHTEITIKGSGFSPVISDNIVSSVNGQIDFTVTSASATELKVSSISSVVTRSAIKVTVKGVVSVSLQEFATEGPIITGISPASGKPGDVITLTGKNFAPSLSEYEHVFFASSRATILSTSATEIKVRVGNDILMQYPPGNPPALDINIAVNEAYGQLKSAFTPISPFTKIGDFPGTGRSFGAAFSIGSSAFLGTGLSGTSSLGDFWKFDANTGIWTRLADFPGGQRGYALGFSINGKGYIMGGWVISNGISVTQKNDLWEYDPITDGWTQRQDYPGSLHAEYEYGAVVVNGKAYLREDKTLYCYDPVSNQWTQPAQPYPGSSAFNYVSMAINGKFYTGLGLYAVDWYELNLLSGTWTRLTDLFFKEWTPAVEIGGNGYIGIGDNSFRYDPPSQTWTPLPPNNIINNGGYYFQLNGMTYFITGNLFGSSGFYSFTPN